MRSLSLLVGTTVVFSSVVVVEADELANKFLLEEDLQKLQVVLLIQCIVIRN